MKLQEGRFCQFQCSHYCLFNWKKTHKTTKTITEHSCTTMVDFSLSNMFPHWRKGRVTRQIKTRILGSAEWGRVLPFKQILELTFLTKYLQEKFLFVWHRVKSRTWLTYFTSQHFLVSRVLSDQTLQANNPRWLVAYEVWWKQIFHIPANTFTYPFMCLLVVSQKHHSGWFTFIFPQLSLETESFYSLVTMVYAITYNNTLWGSLF